MKETGRCYVFLTYCKETNNVPSIHPLLLLLFLCSLLIAGARQVWLLHARILSRVLMVFSGRGVPGKIPLVYLAVFAAVWQWGVLPCDKVPGTAFADPFVVHVLSGPGDHRIISDDADVHLVYGTTGNNQVTVKSGARVHLRHFPGKNTIHIKTDINKCSVVRSGAMVTIRNPNDGTRVKMPATAEKQTLNFNGGSKGLQIIGGNVDLDGLQVNLTEQSLYQAPQPGDEKTIDIGGGVDLILVWIPAGSFYMGSPDGDSAAGVNEKPRHEVTLTQGFWMGKYEVTQAQWKQIMGSNPSDFQGDNLPVERVSWDDVQEFITELNHRTGQTFSLPTEAQWEYAARGGAAPPQKYSGSDDVDQVGWYTRNCDTTHPVGQKSANAWGLHDMTGNVYEWCQDWYDDTYYAGSPSQDPTGPDSGDFRVMRGGSWYYDVGMLEAAARNYYSADVRYNDTGFRLVMQP